MTVSVLVPFKPDGADRDRIWAWNKERWEQTMPDCELVVCTDGSQPGEPFNEGKAWNRCARRATGDVFLIAEAEVAFNAHELRPAVAECERTGGWWVAARYVQLSALQTTNILGFDPIGNFTSKLEKFADRVFAEESVSSILIVPREGFEKVGGYDERYEGWGWIDKAFAAAMNTLYEPLERFPGSMFHLHHPRTTSIDCNPELTRRYLDAAGDRLAMRAIINERDRIAA